MPLACDEALGKARLTPNKLQQRLLGPLSITYLVRFPSQTFHSISLANLWSVSNIEEHVEVLWMVSGWAKEFQASLYSSKTSYSSSWRILRPEGIFRYYPLWGLLICLDLKYSNDMPPNCLLRLLTPFHHIGHLQHGRTSHRVDRVANTHLIHMLITLTTLIRSASVATTSTYSHNITGQAQGQLSRKKTLWSSRLPTPFMFVFNKCHVWTTLLSQQETVDQKWHWRRIRGPICYLLMLWHLEGYVLDRVHTVS